MTTTPLSLSSPEKAKPKSSAASGRPNWLRLARNACLRVPPLWPLQDFVAVNPYLGLAGRPFEQACGLIRRVSHEPMLMGAEYFRKRLAEGRISSEDLQQAIAINGAELEVEDLLSWLNSPGPAPASKVFSLADIAEAHLGGRWNTIITEELSKWCSAYYDEGQSAWRMPWRKLPFFAAWRQAAMIDRNPEMLGLKGFRRLVAGLPDDAAKALGLILEMLEVPAGCVEDYLHRLLMMTPGWSSHVQHHVRERARQGVHDESLLELLAVRLVFELQVAGQFAAEGIRESWFAALPEGEETDPQIQKQLLWQAALEIGFQRELCTQITAGDAGNEAGSRQPAERPDVQAVFCIDVRSEVMRRCMEAASRRIETLGFAGFFGMPIEYVPFGGRHGSSQVPVLLAPKYRVKEQMLNATPEQEKRVRRRMQLDRRVQHSWNAFKTSAVSCFSFVEAAGAGFAWKLLKDGFQIGRRQPGHSCASCTTPNLHEYRAATPGLLDLPQPESGIPPEDQVRLALGALKNMGLTAKFARLVMLCGHGSSTTNNPYAAGLDCGACGGHAGGPNARVASGILNQPEVRQALQKEGVFIPDDTWFVAAQHDTTTDVITVLDAGRVPDSHADDLRALKATLEQAAKLCREERAAGLGLAGCENADLHRLIHERSRDWSQVRPEWGLAGNAAFVAAPRERTRHLNLKGRVFLHSYRHEEDASRATLELILTAPMIVASWINLQYYASTVNNRLWGSGNKALHNVVGTFGVQLGNGGDLQAGLPLQSVHDGRGWFHEPLRLSVFIEAPRRDIDAVLAAHEPVRQLVENGWLHLFAIEQEGGLILRRESSGTWLEEFSKGGDGFKRR